MRYRTRLQVLVDVGVPLGLLARRRVDEVGGRVVDPVRVVEPVALRVLGQQRLVRAPQELHVLAVDAAREELVHHLQLRHHVARLERHAGVQLPIAGGLARLERPAASTDH